MPIFCYNEFRPMEQEFIAYPTVRGVAQKIGLSPYYFSKLFNEYTKTAFPAYLANIRVQRAITLLADPGRSITDCAYEAGFQSTTTFNKLFHELTGTSPREYRKLQSRNK